MKAPQVSLNFANISTTTKVIAYQSQQFSVAFSEFRVDGTVANEKSSFFCCHFLIFEDIATKFGMLM